MKSHFDSGSGNGHQLPTGGEVLGHLADAFQLKGTFDQVNGWEGSDRTARRYLNGEQEKVSPHAARAVVEHLVTVFFPDNYFRDFFEIDDAEMRQRIVAGATEICCRWDAIAGRVNGTRFPNLDPGLSVLPALRLVTFAFGVHWGGFIFPQFTLQQITEEGSPGFPLPWWFRREGTKFIIDAFRKAGDEERTLEDVATRAGVDLQDLTNWRAGKHRPAPFNLTVLAQTLAEDAPEARADIVEFLLRIATGVAHLRGQLEEICGASRIDDLREGFLLVAKKAYLALFVLHNRGLDAQTIARVVAEKGPFCRAGAEICRSIADATAASGSPFVAADFEALSGDWTDRLLYWAKRLAKEPDEQVAEQRHFLQTLMGLPDDAFEKFAHLANELPLRTRDFADPQPVVLMRLLRENDVELSAFAASDLRTVERKLRPYNLVAQAEELFSTGDFATGLFLLEEAIKAEPEEAGLHFKIGCRLGHMALHLDSDELAARAIHECEIASVLDPEWGRPKNEIAVILSNRRRFEEAENAFEAAGLLNKEWHQHHLSRGQNLMWLGRLDEAIICFDKSSELDPTDLRAIEAKGICLLAQGRRQKGKPLLRQVARRTGRDWLTDDRWKLVLDGPVLSVPMSHPIMRQRRRDRQ